MHETYPWKMMIFRRTLKKLKNLKKIRWKTLKKIWRSLRSVVVRSRVGELSFFGIVPLIID